MVTSIVRELPDELTGTVNVTPAGSWGPKVSPTKEIGPEADADHAPHDAGSTVINGVKDAVYCPPMAGTVIGFCPPTVIVPAQIGSSSGACRSVSCALPPFHWTAIVPVRNAEVTFPGM